MESYRIYCLNRFSTFELRDWILANDDDEALAEARRLNPGPAKWEMWAASRFVADSDRVDAVGHVQLRERSDDAAIRAQLREQPDDGVTRVRLREQSEDGVTQPRRCEQADDAVTHAHLREQPDEGVIRMHLRDLL